MSEHLKTIVGFKNGTRSIFSDLRCDVLDALEDLWGVIKVFAKATFVIAVWLFSLCLVVLALPLATYLRIKWEREAKEAHEKAKKELLERMSPVKRGAND